MKERKKYMSKNGIGLLVLWFAVIVIGAVLASIVPVDYKYITGFITGGIAVTILNIRSVMKRE